MTKYRHASVEGIKVFYREDGPAKASAILLLHGFPTSSHMFRNLIPALADNYHVVAPDLPGFGFSGAPDRKNYRYTFEQIAKTIADFTQTIGLNQFAMYVFDYGAPVGFRLALAHPERITAIVSQNGNAYEEGLSEGWNPIQKYWKEPTVQNRLALRAFLTPEATKSQYVYGAPDESLIAPEAYQLDSALLARPGNEEIQLDLFLDYAATSRSILSSRNISARVARRFLRYGERTTHSLSLPARKLTGAIFPMPRFNSWTPGILRSRHTSPKSHPR